MDILPVFVLLYAGLDSVVCIHPDIRGIATCTSEAATYYILMSITNIGFG